MTVLRGNRKRAISATMAVVVIVIIVIAAVVGAYFYSTSRGPPGVATITTPTFVGGFNSTLVSLAEKEGALTVYQGIIPANLATALGQVFQAQFPQIQTNVMSVLSPVLITKITAEVKTGKGIADVIILPSQIDMVALDQQGIFQSYKSPEYSNFDSRFLSSDNDYFFPAQFATFLAYNPQVLKKAGVPPPTSWCDLANPQYNGLVGIGVAWGGLTYIMHYTLYTECGGVSFYANLAKNHPKFEEFPNTAADLASGALGVAPGLDYLIEPLIEKGAPINISIPSQGVIDALVGAGISKVAPHPYAARLFMDWLASPQGQLALEQVQGYIGTRNGVTPYALNPYGAEEVAWLQHPVNANFNVTDMIQKKDQLKTIVYTALGLPT